METDRGGSCGPPPMVLASAINEVVPQEGVEQRNVIYTGCSQGPCGRIQGRACEELL